MARWRSRTARGRVWGARAAAGGTAQGADRLLLSHARLAVRGRRRGAGDHAPRLARVRPLRRPRRAAFLAVPDCHPASGRTALRARTHRRSTDEFLEPASSVQTGNAILIASHTHITKEPTQCQEKSSPAHTSPSTATSTSPAMVVPVLVRWARAVQGTRAVRERRPAARTCDLRGLRRRLAHHGRHRRVRGR